MSINRDVSVIHLVWLPYGIRHFYVFINSYIAHTASYPHELIIVFNGLSNAHPNKPEEYIAFLKENNIHSYRSFYFDKGQDIEIYKKISDRLKSEVVFFLNSFSEIENDNWLKKYIENFNEDVGVIGATGSLQSYYSSVFQKNTFCWESERGFLYNFKKYKLFLKAFFYWRFFFRPFPDPHLRTNAFMVRREEFLAMKSKPLTSKFKAYQFESGRKSLTEYYLKKGLKVLVMDRFGKIFETQDWQSSKTFWIGAQENLSISDNQTRIYDEADAANKKLMTKLAWGINE